MNIHRFELSPTVRVVAKKSGFMWIVCAQKLRNGEWVTHHEVCRSGDRIGAVNLALIFAQRIIQLSLKEGEGVGAGVDDILGSEDGN